jgi:hypothetical protein
MSYHRTGKSKSRRQRQDAVASLNLARLGEFRKSCGWLAVLILTGCAHLPVNERLGPGGALLYVTKAGLVFKDAGHTLWLREGVPASYFTHIGPGEWYINNIDWHAGNAMRIQK